MDETLVEARKAVIAGQTPLEVRAIFFRTPTTD